MKSKKKLKSKVKLVEVKIKPKVEIKVEPKVKLTPEPVLVNRLALRYGSQADCEKAKICASKGCVADAVVGNVCALCAKQLG